MCQVELLARPMLQGHVVAMSAKDLTGDPASNSGLPGLALLLWTELQADSL